MVSIAILLLKPQDSLTLERICKKAGYFFKQESNLDSAVNLVDNESFDLIICELSPPSMMGLELLTRVKERIENEGIGVIVVSQFYKEMEAKRIIAEVIQPLGFIRAPIIEEEGERILRDIIKKGGWGKKIVIEDEESEEWERYYSLKDEDLTQGRLDEIRSFVLIYYLILNKKTGILTFDLEKEKTKLFFREGRLIKAESDWIGFNPLVYLRLKRGIESKIVTNIEKESKAKGIPLLSYLVTNGILSPHEVALLNQELYRVLMARIAEYKTGNYSFLPGIPEQFEESLFPFESNLLRVLVDSILSIKDREWFENYFNGISRYIFNISYSMESNQVPLNPTASELKVLSRAGEVTGEEFVDEVAGKSEEKRKKYIKDLVALHFIGVIESTHGDSREDIIRLKELKKEKQRLEKLDAHEILGVDSSSSHDEIKERFLELSRKYHPDTVPSNNPHIKKILHDIFLIISSAHESLTKEDSTTEDSKEFKDLQASMDGSWSRGNNPIAAKIEFAKGIRYYRNKKYHEALQHFGWAKELNHEEAEYRAYYGWSLFLKDSRNAPTALTEINEALKLNDRSEIALLLKGYLLKVTGDVKGAMDIFRHILTINPNNIEALREVKIYEMREREKKKRGLFNRLFRRRRKD